MIKNLGSKFRFLAARSFEQTVVYNKGVDTVIICQRLNCGSSFFGEQSCETKPVDPGIVQKAVKTMGFVGNYALHGLSLQTNGMPVIPKNGPEVFPQGRAIYDSVDFILLHNFLHQMV